MRKLWISLISVFFVLCSQTANAQSGLFVAPNTSVFTSPVAGQSWLFNSTTKTISVYTGSSWLTNNYPFSNLTATTNPTSGNDNTQGYVIGSFWINQNTQTLYMATAVGTGTAVWLGINQVTSTIPLANIQQGGATDGQSLVWDNGSGVWAPENPAINLNQLLQSGATSGQGITWNGSTWVASNVGAGTVTTVSTGNLSPLFTASIANPTSTPALSFSLSNAASKGIYSNTSGSSAAPAFNALTLTAGTGLVGGGNLADSPTISLDSPVTVANGGTGAATFSSHTFFGNNTGSTAAPANVSITAADLPSSVAAGVTNSATILNANISTQNLALSYSGTALPFANGGTNSTSRTAALNNLIAGSPSSGQALAFDGTNWVPTTVSGTGTVTSVAMTGDNIIFNTSVTGSPVTTSGTLVPSLKTQNANTILAGPSTGSAATPTFRFLAANDLPSTTVNSTGGLSALFSASITGQALSFTQTNAISKGIFSNTTGSGAAPSFNVLTITAGTGLIGGGNLADSPTISLDSPVTVAHGGTGLTSTPANGQLHIGNGSGFTLATLTAGNGIAVTNGSGSSTISIISPVTVANGGTGTALFSSGTSTFATAGSVAVVDATITSSSIIVVTQVGSTALAETFSVVAAASTGFTIYSSNPTSTAVVNWIRIK